jgi:hypothetical protein
VLREAVPWWGEAGAALEGGTRSAVAAATLPDERRRMVMGRC